MKRITIENLTFNYERNGIMQPVFKGINIDVEPGDFVVVLGKSGCGKTTLLNLIAGLIPPPEGTILVDEQPVTKPHFSRTLIFQQPRLLPWLNVWDNIAFGCRLRGDTANLKKRVERLITIIGLEGYEHSRPDSLSAGMAQRVAIARGLLGDPHVLLLDEPFAGLDYVTRARLQQEVVRLWKKHQFTAIFVTHDIEEALIVGRRIVMLSSNPAKIIHDVDYTDPIPRSYTGEIMYKRKVAIQDKFNTLEQGV